jgi:membrane protein DedA with SNARE-associated domain
MILADLAQWFVQTSNYLIATFGYLGVFLVGFIGSAAIVLPIPSYAVVFLAASTLNLFLVGLFAGLGASLGELVAYTLGKGGRKFILKDKKREKEFIQVESLFQKYGGFFAIIIIAATPIPDNVLGIFCGMIKYPIKKYFAASLIGKLIFHMVIAYAGFYSIGFIANLLGIA